jgi:hypothetical protein
MHYLTLCCIAKDENARIAEWAAYHALRGVEKIVVYDNGSAKPLARTLEPLFGRIDTVVYDMSGPARQMAAYAHCLEHHGPGTHWLAFIDVDEFLLPKGEDDLRVLLSAYEPHAGLGVNWVMFGSAGHETPPELAIEAFTRRPPYAFINNHHIKSIVRPPYVKGPLSPHHFAYAPGRHCVNEQGFPLPGPYGPHHNARLQLNHYFFRSRQEFAEKIARGRGDMTTDQFKHSMRDFEMQLGYSTEEDTEIARFGPAVRAVLGGEALPAPATTDFARDSEKVALLLSRGRVDLAEAASRTFPVAYNDQSAAWSLRGLVLARAGRHAEARQALAASLRLEQTVENLANLVRIQRLAGETDEARRTARYLWWRLHNVDAGLRDECAAILDEIRPLMHDAAL